MKKLLLSALLVFTVSAFSHAALFRACPAGQRQFGSGSISGGGGESQSQCIENCRQDYWSALRACGVGNSITPSMDTCGSQCSSPGVLGIYTYNFYVICCGK